jgi:hypothetical protein
MWIVVVLSWTRRFFDFESIRVSRPKRCATHFLNGGGRREVVPVGRFRNHLLSRNGNYTSIKIL